MLGCRVRLQKIEGGGRPIANYLLDRWMGPAVCIADDRRFRHETLAPEDISGKHSFCAVAEPASHCDLAYLQPQEALPDDLPLAHAAPIASTSIR
jgi:hypothetical protein